MTHHIPPNRIREVLLARLSAGPEAPIADDEFSELALSVFRHQYSANRPYRAFCERRGVEPTSLTHWTEIPEVPTSAFKSVPLVCGEAAEAERVFRTSGTTAGYEKRGEHYVPDLSLYDEALRAGFRTHLLPDGARPRMLSLIPPAEVAQDSSLSYMATAVVREFGAVDSDFFVAGDVPDLARVREALGAAESEQTPVCLLATSFALSYLLDGLVVDGRGFELAAGSRLMDTGGSKGRAHELSREDLYARADAWLRISPTWCVNEYGMTEMGSQFYDTRAGEPAGAVVASRRYVGPGWVRTRAVDPESLRLLPDGEPGILRHWDLANLGSVMVLQTEDLGVCGDGGFVLHGRAAAAEPRGCSLALEELLTAVGRG